MTPDPADPAPDLILVDGLSAGRAAAGADEYTTRRLAPETWEDFADLVETNNGVWGGCWCAGFHPGGIPKGTTAAANREAKRTHVNRGTVHQMLVYAGDECVGSVQYGPPGEVASIKNPKAYEKELVDLPDWRIGCVFTGSTHRRQGVARAGLATVLREIREGGRRRRRGLPRATGRPSAAARGISPYRTGDSFRRVRLRPRSAHRQVALGHASRDPRPGCTDVPCRVILPLAVGWRHDSQPRRSRSRFHPPRPGAASPSRSPPSGQERRPVLLPQGRHAGLHDPGLRRA